MGKLCWLCDHIQVQSSQVSLDNYIILEVILIQKPSEPKSTGSLLRKSGLSAFTQCLSWANQN